MSSTNLNSIINGDACEQLNKIPAESVDLIVTSPPYNASLEYEQILSDKHGPDISTSYVYLSIMERSTHD